MWSSFMTTIDNVVCTMHFTLHTLHTTLNKGTTGFYAQVETLTIAYAWLWKICVSNVHLFQNVYTLKDCSETRRIKKYTTLLTMHSQEI